MLQIIKIVNIVLVGLLTLINLDLLVLGLFSFKRRKPYLLSVPTKRLAAVIPARNEAIVLPGLIESLRKQSYPPELFEIIVIPNNCTDDTLETAERLGASVFMCEAIVSSKGDVLHQYFDSVIHQPKVFDAYCIFDADNLVHPNFFTEANRLLENGAKIIQGRRENKNPFDTAISAATAIYNSFISRFMNLSRSNFGFSAMLNGTGIVLSHEFMVQNNGWNTFSVTEDVEFTIQAAISGTKIEWCDQAIIYDEQAVTFKDSYAQRLRWSLGMVRCLKPYTIPLLSNPKRSKYYFPLDMLIFLAAPVVQILFFISMLLGLTLMIFRIPPFYIPFLSRPIGIVSFLLMTYCGFIVSAVFLVLLDRKNLWKYRKGILTFGWFVLSWIWINVDAIFSRKYSWTIIPHTRKVDLEEIENE